MRFWLMIAVFILAGCGGDDDNLKDVTPVVAFLSANPPSGATITPNAAITLTFDNDPGDVTASAGVVSGAAKPVRSQVRSTEILSHLWCIGRVVARRLPTLFLPVVL